MPTALPPASDATGASRTEGQIKTFFTAQRGFLAGLFGTDGVIATALSSLGIGTAGLLNTGTSEGDIPLLGANGLPAVSGQDLTKVGLTGKHAIPVIARSLAPTTTNGCGDVEKFETPTNKINYQALPFDASAEEKAFIMFAAPKSSDETAGIFIRGVKWSHPATAANFGVVWEFEILAVGDDDALDAAVGTAVTVADTGGTTEDTYTASESTEITPAGSWAEGDDLYLQISRKVADGSDTLAVDARLRGFEIIITSNAGNDA